MRYVDEFRDPELITKASEEIRRLAEPGRHYRIMEVCGGHTHAIYRFGLKDILPDNIELIHGPGCPVCVLPMGRIDEGESAAETAVREVREETGVEGRLVEKLGDVRYVYTARREGAHGERIFKVVSFFLLRAGRGRIGEIDESMRVEVAEAQWLPLDEAPRLLSYDGERKMAAKAWERIGA